MRDAVGHDLLLLPAVAVLPRDEEGRVLLVRQSDNGRWATIGGSVEVDETPQVAATREAAEEAGVTVAITRLIAAHGGPQFRVSYPNGDEVSYVSLVYEARVVDGQPEPDYDETVEVSWFHLDDLATLDLGAFARHTFVALGWLGEDDTKRQLRLAYDTKANERDEMNDAPWKQPERKRFLDVIRSNGAERLLEIGAGHGVSGRFFADHGVHVTCIDLSPELVDDEYEPKRFFSLLTADEIQQAAVDAFEVVDYRLIPLDGSRRRYHGLVLRPR